MLSLNLDIHRVVKNHKTIHYLSPQGEGKQSSLLSLLVIILLSGNKLFKIICQRILWSHIILNVEWYVSPFTCRWMKATVLIFSPLGENVNTKMVLIHQQMKKSAFGKIVKNHRCCQTWLAVAQLLALAILLSTLSSISTTAKKKFWVGIFNSQSHISQVHQTAVSQNSQSVTDKG